jgi:hypothetical protein
MEASGGCTCEKSQETVINARARKREKNVYLFIYLVTFIICIICGGAGHMAKDCTKAKYTSSRVAARAASTSSAPPASNSGSPKESEK